METVLAGIKIIVNEEGYLEDSSNWTKELGTEIARKEGIEMTPRHWEVIAWLQLQVKEGKALSIRSVKNSGVIDIKEFYALFPNGPLKISTKIAGLQKPKSCI